jgi:iron complex outermembrane recepter protein
MKKLLPLLAAGASLAGASAPVLAAHETQRRLWFSIESQNLGDALNEWAKQSGFRIGSRIDGAIVAPEVKGLLTPEAALEQLLEGTSLTHKWQSARFVAIYGSSMDMQREPPAAGVKRVDAGADADSHSGPPELPANLRSRARARDKPEEVIVTGTHIRGVTHSASPLRTYGRSEIEAAGVGTIQAFLQSLPRNFAGGASDNTVMSVTGAGNSDNRVGASGVNLRGLGNDATLLLLNGRRIAPGNISGNFVDISMIPLSAVERIEILPDSAAAIYGSDAIGGVVNVILRSTFDGAETRARHGFVADGDSTETQIAQTLGREWYGGSALANYEYSNRSARGAAPRS